MRILVTGGAGFVGSHLCARLLELGNDVVRLDNFSSGSAVNVHALGQNQRVTLVEHDVTSPFEIDVEQIYNLACPASPAFYQKDPLRTLKASVLGAVNMLELARKAGATILQASTSEVYGDPNEHPQSESLLGTRESDWTEGML